MFIIFCYCTSWISGTMLRSSHGISVKTWLQIAYIKLKQWKLIWDSHSCRKKSHHSLAWRTIKISNWNSASTCLSSSIFNFPSILASVSTATDFPPTDGDHRYRALHVSYLKTFGYHLGLNLFLQLQFENNPEKNNDFLGLPKSFSLKQWPRDWWHPLPLPYTCLAVGRNSPQKRVIF